MTNVIIRSFLLRGALFVLLSWVLPFSHLFAQSVVECGNEELCGALITNTPDSLIFDFSNCRDSRGRLSDGLVIRVDSLRRQVFKCQIAIRLTEAQVSNFTPGFYRVWATIDYSGSQQSNESFYFEGANSEGAFGPCDSTNIRNYRVVVPDENQLANGDTILIRDAGMFFLNPDETMFLKHYQLLVDPSVTPNPTRADSIFINGGGFDGPESVHLLQLKLVRTEGTDELQLSKTAQKNSVNPGESFGYTLNLTNTSADTVFDIQLWDALPDSVDYIPGSATTRPELSTGADSLFWNFGFLEPNASIEINYEVLVSDQFEISVLPVTLSNTSQVRSECDIDTAQAAVTVIAPPTNCDLALFKTASVQSVAAGGEFEYTLRVVNQADSPAVNITLSDTLPEFVAPINWPGAIKGNLLDLGIDFLDFGEDTTITFRARVAETLPDTVSNLINRSGVAASCDFNLLNNFAMAAVAVTAPDVCDLSLTKNSSADTVQAGDEFVYSLRISNAGPDTAFDLTLSDTLPAFVTALDWPGIHTDNFLTLTMDSLASQQDTTITFTAKLADVLPDSVFELVNRSGVASDCDANANNNLAAKAMIVLPRPCDLSLSKTADMDSVQRGDEVTYHLTITNSGPETAYEMTLRDTLPDFITALNWPGSQTDNVLTLTIDSLAVQQSTTVSFSARVADILPDSITTLVNRSGIASNCDQNLLNNFAADTLYVFRPEGCELVLAKTASVDSVRAGDEFEYVLTITNRGQDAAFDVTLTDTLPAFIEALDWPGTQTENILELSVGNIDPAQNRIITFMARVADPLPDTVSQFVNKSFVAAPCDSAGAKNVASLTIFVKPPEQPIVCDLTLEKSADVTNVQANQEFSYTITIRNLGRDVARDVTLTDTLPAYVQPLDWPGSINGNILTLAIPTLAQDTTIIFRAKVAATLPDTLVELVNRSGIRADCDQDLTNNFSSASVIPPQAGEDCIVLNVNVFRPERTELSIEFEMNQAGHVRMDLHDISGYAVTNLVDDDFNAGRHTISWNGRAGVNQAGLEVGSGVYIVIFRSDAPPFFCKEKVILVR